MMILRKHIPEPCNMIEIDGMSKTSQRGLIMKSLSNSQMGLIEK